ncbi:Rgg/GadR/MutR family transcriptional activator [Lactobacillus colini]|uniref:Rgg/GadR/MutR family transcriptional activator n=1 Tax=Lactobacillus colini TaxID=1819254 RepID=A0ABS4MH08_9LACO|nr:Rgg/GadR/MutR family transcriptional regulator [Lactobacillus colini]MBP2058991.1 Rgg/GadR/MutR family transcriptional activator [Lactobacillus colini]
MKKYGIAFRNIRKAKNITIKQAASNVVTPAFLSKFERGESEISFSRLINILNNINVDINEFLLEANHFENTSENYFLEKLAKAVELNSQDLIDSLIYKEKSIYEENKNIRYLHNICLASLYKSLINKEKPLNKDWEPIKNYLLYAENWGYYEFLLYANAMPFLPTDIIKILSKQVYQKGIKYISLSKNKNSLIDTLLNTIEIFIKRRELNLIPSYFNMVKLLIDSPDFLFEKTRLIFYQGANLYLSGEHNLGIDKMKTAFDILNLSGYQGAQLVELENLKQEIIKNNI